MCEFCGGDDGDDFFGNVEGHEEGIENVVNVFMGRVGEVVFAGGEEGVDLGVVWLDVVGEGDGDSGSGVWVWFSGVGVDGVTEGDGGEGCDGVEDLSFLGRGAESDEGELAEGVAFLFVEGSGDCGGIFVKFVVPGVEFGVGEDEREKVSFEDDGEDVVLDGERVVVCTETL